MRKWGNEELRDEDAREWGREGKMKARGSGKNCEENKIGYCVFW